jgi:hypothetical protein
VCARPMCGISERHGLGAAGSGIRRARVGATGNDAPAFLTTTDTHIVTC